MNLKLFFTLALSFILSFVSAGTLGAFEPTNSTLTGNCGGNCPGNNCPSCPCGTSPSKQDIAHWCAQYSGWNQAHCQCIISHESGGNANAVCHNTNGSNDVGLWQVNDFNWASCSGGSAPCSPSANLECAKKVFGWGGNTWKYWSTCGTCGVCNSN